MAAPTAQPARRLLFLDVLRAGGMALVVWAHLVPQWLDRNGRGWIPVDQERRYLASPLALIQDIGWLGVAMFFLVTGFTVSQAVVSETGAQYAVRRFLRIYPALALGVFAAWGVQHVRVAFDVIDSGPKVVPVPDSLADVLRSTTLLNYLMVPQPIVLYVAWTLVVQVIFYILVFLAKPLFQRAWLVPWTLLGIVLVALETARRFGDSYFLLVASVSYLPIILAGQVIWLRWSHRIGTPHFLVLTAASWVMFVRGLEIVHPEFLPATNSYGATLALTWAIFVFALLSEHRLRPNRAVAYVASRSYSVYLLHGPLGLLVLDSLGAHVPYTVALIVALAVVAAASEASYRIVETPSRRLARRVPGRRPLLPPAGPRIESVPVAAKF